MNIKEALALTEEAERQHKARAEQAKQAAYRAQLRDAVADMPTIYAVRDDDCFDNSIGGYVVGPQEPSAFVDEFWKAADFNPADFEHSLSTAYVENQRARIEAQHDAARRLHELGYAGSTLGQIFVDWLCKERGFIRVEVEWSLFPIGCG